VFTAPDEGTASRYASFDRTGYAAPRISTVPEPTTIGFLGLGGAMALWTMLRRRR
jgi:hypothetical protein